MTYLPECSSWAVAMHGDEQPELQPADLETARSYLKKCVSRMSTAEIQASADDTFASLWAKGTVGAAKYRVRGALVGPRADIA